MNEFHDTYSAWIEEQAEPADALSAHLDALYQSGPEPKAVADAQLVLKQALDAHLPATIHYDLLAESPLGPLWVAAGPKGLVAVEYGGKEADFRAYLAKLTGGRPRRHAGEMEAAKRMLLAYLNGQQATLQLDVDLSGITDFQRRVLEETRRVPRGQVASYAQIAKRIGQPKAVRAVGQALRRNPIPIVVPCHRVIASDGSLGGYAGEMRSQKKVELLRLEGVALA